MLLKSIRNAHVVWDLLGRQANTVRGAMLRRRHDLDIEQRRAGANQLTIGGPTLALHGTGVPPTTPAIEALAQPSQAADDDLLAQLENLVSLHQSGVLTADEFASAKAKLLR